MAEVATPPPTAAPPVTPSADIMAEQNRFEQQHIQDTNVLQQQREAEAGPMRESALQASQALSQAVQAPVQKVPLPENSAKHLDPKVMNDAASAWMTLGALMGLASRQPFTAALNNMSAAMEGVKKGDADQFAAAHDEFKTNFDAAMKRNKAMLDERKTVIDDKNLDLTAKVNALHLVDAKYGTLQQNLNAPFTLRMKEYDGQIKASQNAEQKMRDADAAMQRIRATAEVHERLARLEGKITGAVSPGGGPAGPATSGIGANDVSAWKYLLLGKEPPGMGNKSAEQRMAVRNQAAKLGAELGLTPLEQAMLPTNNAMKVKAADALTKWGAFVEKSQANITADLDLVVQAARKVDPGTLMSINQAILAGEKQFQDGDAQAYALAVNKLNTEYIRLQQGPLSNAMLHVDAAKKADQLLSYGISADSWDGAVRQMITAEASNTRRSVVGVRDSLMSDVSTAGGRIADPNKASQSSPPIDKLKEGHVTTFGNGQKWMLQGGKAVQVQ